MTTIRHGHTHLLVTLLLAVGCESHNSNFVACVDSAAVTKRNKENTGTSIYVSHLTLCSLTGCDIFSWNQKLVKLPVAAAVVDKRS